MRKLLIFFIIALALPAFAQDKNQASNSDNSKQPILIDADTLEVYQADQKAIFTGKVVAVQGTMTVRSDKMTIYYLNKDEQTDNAKTKKAPDPKKPGDASTTNNAIKRIDVEGNVFLTAPNQNAKSLKGYYDVQKSFVNLTGDVVLTKDTNILKGNKLDYYTDTGYSKLYSDPAPVGSKGRVRGLFVPAPTDDEKK